MAQDNFMAEVDRRTNLAFSNEMEMLTFFLNDDQLYGINVFKIVEILECPKEITQVPGAHEAIVGTIDFRGKAVPMLDLSKALELTPTNFENELSYVIICEYSTSVQGFMVKHPNMLLNKKWDDIIAPDGDIYTSSYLTAITYHNDEAIQILDVEMILGDIIGIDEKISDSLLERGKELDLSSQHILAVDDSRAARALLHSALEQMELQHTIMDNAHDAFNELENMVADGGKCPYTLIISDIEMPKMDGFTFTRKVKSHPKLKDIYLVLHSSLSNKSNKYKAEQMGANDFIPKFQPDKIANTLLEQIGNAKSHTA